MFAQRMLRPIMISGEITAAVKLALVAALFCFAASARHGCSMFLLRSFFWLSTLVMLLPPSADGQQPPPRVTFLQTAYAAKILLQDLTGVCERNSEACAASRDALALVSAKLETGAGIVASGVAASRSDGGLFRSPADVGTLKPEDLQPAWSVSEVQF